MAPDPHFAIICLALADRQRAEIPLLLRRLFATSPFRTRRNRLGKIARVTHEQVQYYTMKSWAVQTINWS
jgi:hypothetical protein